MEKSSFFNAELVGESYDRTYLAEDYVEYFASFIGNGVFPNPSNNLQVIADGTNMNIALKAGKAWINGYYYRNTDELILPIAPADGVLNRIDRVVLRLDFLNREIKCYVKKGVFASNPVAIELQRDADMYEIGIADIKVNKGIIKITQADITDLRQNSNYCGIVHGTVDQVDVTTLFNQYEKALELKEQGFEEEFITWFNNIKGQLSGDVATNLAGQIENINEQLGEKVNYTDFTPIVTTGEASAYIATIPSTLTEVTIVPHIDNLEGATLNGKTIKGRDGKPIRAKVLKANIPIKLVGIGNDFFIVNGEGGGGALELEGTHTRILGFLERASDDSNSNVGGTQYYKDMVANCYKPTGSSEVALNILKYDTLMKKYKIKVIIRLKTKLSLQYEPIVTDIKFSEDGMKIYIALECQDYNERTVLCGLYQIDVNSYETKTVATNTFTQPTILYANEEYVYYNNYVSGNYTYFKVRTNDLSIVTSKVGMPNGFDSNLGDNYSYFSKTNNRLYTIDGSYLYTVDLNTLTYTTTSLGLYSQTTNKKRGMCCDDTYLYLIAQPSQFNGSTTTIFKYNLNSLSTPIATLGSLGTRVNPNNYYVGYYPHVILYFDEVRNIMWLDSGYIYTNDNYPNGFKTESVIVGLDLSNDFAIVDSIMLKNLGKSSSKTLDLPASSNVRDTMFSAKYGGIFVMADVENGTYITMEK